MFSTLTGGRAALRLKPQQATELIEDDFVPLLRVTTLSPSEVLRALRECSSRGVQGGAIYDFLHLFASRKAKAQRLYTLNPSHFRAFYRAGDPAVMHP